MHPSDNGPLAGHLTDPGTPRKTGTLGRRSLTLAIAACCLGMPAAQALQLIEARDGVAVEAILSIKEPTRIRIEGAPITEVFGNIHTSQCQPGASGPAHAGTSAAQIAQVAQVTSALPPSVVNPAGEVLIECDRDKGEIYVRPVGDSAKPVNLFIASAQATYTLILRRSDTPADTIVIRDPTRRQGPADPAHTASPGRLGPSAQPIRAMKAMLVALASDPTSTALPAGFVWEEMHQPQQLWAEARLLLIRRVEGRGLVGETFLLQNISGAEMVLAEPEFDRPDSPAGGQVIGVAIENHRLHPDERSLVYVIRRGGLP